MSNKPPIRRSFSLASAAEGKARSIRYRRFARSLPPALKRIRRWRDWRLTGLIHGGLVTPRRTSFVIRHKSKQRRHLRHQHY